LAIASAVLSINNKRSGAPSITHVAMGGEAKCSTSNFSYPHHKIVISTEAAHAFGEQRSGEIRFST
jgi:hypothetical protein